MGRHTFTTTTRLGIAAVALLAAAGCSAGATGTDGGASPGSVPADPPVTDGPPSWLFVVQGDDGTYTPSDDGSAVITVDGVSANDDAIAFSDRPHRLASRADVGLLAAEWDNLFADAAPNAAVSLEQADSETRDVIVVTITSLTYDGHKLEMTVTPLADVGDDSGLTTFVAKADAELEPSFGKVDLFIDTFERDADNRFYREIR